MLSPPCRRLQSNGRASAQAEKGPRWSAVGPFRLFQDGTALFHPGAPSSLMEEWGGQLLAAVPCTRSHPSTLSWRLVRKCDARNPGLAVLLLADAVLLELLVQVRAGSADGVGGGGDVPLVVAQLLHQEGALGGLLEVAQRGGRFRRRGAGPLTGSPQHAVQV